MVKIVNVFALVAGARISLNLTKENIIKNSINIKHQTKRINKK